MAQAQIATQGDASAAAKLRFATPKSGRIEA
jgi:hypothetical protein